MNPDFQTLRVKMVDGQLRTTDVTNYEILSAFLSVPRELFVSEAQRELAYLDDDLLIAPKRYMMEPSPLAKLLQLALIKSTDKILIVGAGTGYSAAVVAQVAANVFALEADDNLTTQAKSNLAQLNVGNVECVTGSLQTGIPSQAPFDVVFIEGSVQSVASALFDQLQNGGRLVVVEGQGLTGVANCYVKSGKTYAAARAFNIAVKPLPGFESPASFVF